MVRKRMGYGQNTVDTMKAAGDQLNQSDNIFIGTINVTLVDINRVTLDSTNPRRLSIKDKICSDLLKLDDPEYETKKTSLLNEVESEEIEKLESLAVSIKKNGLLNAIVVSKNLQKKETLEVITGERRYLACRLLNFDSIPVKIYNKKLSELALKQIQWSENMDREDLSLSDKLHNIRQIVESAGFKKVTDISQRKLAELTNLKKTHAARYHSILKEDDASELMQAINTNKISNLKIIEKICQVKDLDKKNSCLKLALNGANILEIDTVINNKKQPTVSSNPLNDKISFSISSETCNKLIKSLSENKIVSIPRYNQSDLNEIKQTWRNVVSQVEEI